MSRFVSATATCAACAAVNTLDFPDSVNADRRDDLRNAILDGTLYIKPCAQCGELLFFDPQLTYLDVGRGQWILVDAPDAAAGWRAAEAGAVTVYDLAFGASAPGPARQIGAGLVPRLVFGWPALVEKLRCEEVAIDDVTLELVKLAVIRDGPYRELGPDRDLRLRGREDTVLIMDWLDPATGAADARLKVPYTLYEDLQDAETALQPLRAELAGQMYVDIGRVLRPGDAT